MALTLPAKFSAAFISKNFFPEDYKAKNLMAINSGRCYDWAYIGYCLWPSVVLWTTDCHAWIQSGRKFYDSESHRGLKDHQELRCNSDWPGDEQAPTVMPVDEFKHFWNVYGGGRRFHWDKLVKQIKELGLTPIRE